MTDDRVYEIHLGSDEEMLNKCDKDELVVLERCTRYQSNAPIGSFVVYCTSPEFDENWIDEFFNNEQEMQFIVTNVATALELIKLNK